ncbi:MAG: hypothetical protein GY749_20495 [Desulfobacteraceae bacterium]|nr:hypothetical protein [Desulfobacteraceae bacterium]
MENKESYDLYELYSKKPKKLFRRYLKYILPIVFLLIIIAIISYLFQLRIKVKLEDSLHAKSELTKSLNYTVELDNMQIGTYTNTEEVIQDSDFIRKKMLFDMTIEKVRVKLDTTEIYDKSDKIIPKRIYAVQQIIEIPNMDMIKSKFNSLPDKIKNDLKKIGILISNNVYIKGDMIIPNRKKQLINGETVTPDNNPLKVPKNYASDLFQADLYLLKAINNQIVLSIYDPIEHTFSKYTMKYEGKITYKGKSAADIK